MEAIKLKYKSFKDKLLMKKSFTKLELITEKYNELQECMSAKEYSHKFSSIIPQNKDISQVILYSTLTFKGKDTRSVIERLLSENHIELDDDDISDITTHVFEFLYILEDLKLY